MVVSLVSVILWGRVVSHFVVLGVFGCGCSSGVCVVVSQCVALCVWVSQHVCVCDIGCVVVSPV